MRHFSQKGSQFPMGESATHLESQKIDLTLRSLRIFLNNVRSILFRRKWANWNGNCCPYCTGIVASLCPNFKRNRRFSLSKRIMKSRCISFDLVTIEVIFLILFGLIVTSYAVIPKISWGADCTVENKWVSTAAGKSHSLGIKSDGTLWAWGGNGVGQLGDGTTIERHSPIQIGTDNHWVSMAGGRIILSL